MTTNGVHPRWRIGHRAPNIRAFDAVTGRTRFTDDLTFPGMLHAKLVRSPHPHAKILSIDTREALALPGVRAAITGRDMPVRYGIIPWTRDEFPLALAKALIRS